MSKRAAAGSSKGGPAARSKAARAEKKPEPKVVEFQGQSFTLVPETLPVTIEADLVAMELAGVDGRPFWRLLMSFIGPEQYAVVRNYVGATGIEESGETVGKLLSDIMGAYGVSPGESSASASG